MRLSLIKRCDCSKHHWNCIRNIWKLKCLKLKCLNCYWSRSSRSNTCSTPDDRRKPPVEKSDRREKTSGRVEGRRKSNHFAARNTTAEGDVTCNNHNSQFIGSYSNDEWSVDSLHASISPFTFQPLFISFINQFNTHFTLFKSNCWKSILAGRVNTAVWTDEEKVQECWRIRNNSNEKNRKKKEGWWGGGEGDPWNCLISLLQNMEANETPLWKMMMMMITTITMTMMTTH